MPTYVYLAHGSECTILNKGKRIPNRQTIIPERCTLSTITESGVTSNLSDMARLIRMASVSETIELMKSPIENYDKLSILLSGLNNEYLLSIPKYKKLSNEGYLYGNTKKGPITEYHLKTEGERYSERSFNFLFVNDDGTDSVKIYRSGMYDIENVFPPLSNKIVISVSKDKANLPVSEFLKLYEGSIYPSQEELKKLIKNKKSMSYWDIVYIIEKFRTTQSNLLKIFPGNHYNFSCRSYNSNEVNENIIKLTRQNSFRITQQRKRAQYNINLAKHTEKMSAFRRPLLSVIQFQFDLLSKKDKLTERQKEKLIENINYLIEYHNEGELIKNSNTADLCLNIDKCIEKKFINPSDIEKFKELNICPKKGGKRNTRKKSRYLRH